MFCALLTSRYQVSVYRTNGPLVSYRSPEKPVFDISKQLCGNDVFFCLETFQRQLSCLDSVKPFERYTYNLLLHI